MAILDLTPESDDNANQTFVEFAATPEGQAAIQKLADSAGAAQRGMAKALAALGLATPVLDAAREEFAQYEGVAGIARRYAEMIDPLPALDEYVKQQFASFVSMMQQAIAAYPVLPPIAFLATSPPNDPPAKSLQRRLQKLEDELAVLRYQVREAQTRARNAEARAAKTEIRLAQAMPPLWAREPPNDYPSKN